MSETAALPVGWAPCTLDDVVVQASTKARPGDAGCPGDFLGMDDVEADSGRVLRTQRSASLKSIGNVARPGDLVYGRLRPYLNKVAVAPRDLLCSGELLVLRARPEVDQRFLKWLLRSPAFVTYAVSSSQGDRPRVYWSELARFPVVLPPKQEQRRIADEVERRLSHVEAAERSLESIRAKLASARQAVIHAAMTGQLGGGPQGQVSAEVREKAVSTGAGVPTIPGHWCWLLLKDALREPMRNGRSAPTAATGTGVRIFTITAVTRRDWGLHNTKWGAGDPDKLADLFVKDGDIFVQRSNTPELVGTSALYRGTDGVATFPDLLIRVRTGDDVLPEWVESVLRWHFTRNYLRSVASGLSGSMPKVDQTKVGKVLVPVPPLSEQRSLTAELSRRLSIIDAAERVVDEGLRRNRVLRTATLSAAFQGQLVPQHAGDEPASKLLDDLRAERTVPARKPGRAGRPRTTQRKAS